MDEMKMDMSFATRWDRMSAAWRSFLNNVSTSKFNLRAAYAVDMACPLLFGYLGLQRQPSWLLFAVSAVLGWWTFTLVEYAIHRWLLHNPKCFLYPLHDAHHKNPNVPAGFLFPTTIAVLGPIWFLFAQVLHIHGASFFLCGFSAGYFYYDNLHYLEHSLRINQIPFRWLQGIWAAHSVHHKLDHTNYGVMTSFWDHVFKTYYRQGEAKRVAR